jgi:hypothetical protein
LVEQGLDQWNRRFIHTVNSAFHYGWNEGKCEVWMDFVILCMEIPWQPLTVVLQFAIKVVFDIFFLGGSFRNLWFALVRFAFGLNIWARMYYILVNRFKRGGIVWEGWMLEYLDMYEKIYGCKDWFQMNGTNS